MGWGHGRAGGAEDQTFQDGWRAPLWAGAALMRAFRNQRMDLVPEVLFDDCIVLARVLCALVHGLADVHAIVQDAIEVTLVDQLALLVEGAFLLGVIAWVSTIRLDGAALFPGNIAYVWHGALHATTVAESLVDNGFTVRAQIIWAKERLVLGRGDYHWQHEPCWYAVRSKGNWTGDRKQTTLWTIASGGQDSETSHSTQKPVECMRRPMQNNSNPGQAVYDPFLGSGTTLIAAETTGRVCLGMELEPRYVDVAVRRWQAFTGLDACLLGDGRSFAVVAAERLAGLQTTNLDPAPTQPVETAVKNDPAAT